MPTSRYTIAQTTQVENMLREGHTFPQIMQATQLDRNAVDYITRKFKKNGGMRGNRQTANGQAKALNGGQSGIKGLDLSEIENITGMSAEERLKLWLKYWQATFELARDDEDLVSLRPLLAQFAAKLVERQSSEPIIQIQPIEFSPVIIPRPVVALAHDLCNAVVDLLKANLVIDDDAQQLLNALVKYCPHLNARE
jgi:hypothetical protein